MDYKYILVNGYTSTGSSAPIDFLREYSNVYAPDKEFRIIKDPHGIYDLDKALNMSTDLLNDDIAAREFLWLAKKYYKEGSGFRSSGQAYYKEFGKDFYRLSEEYINDLSSYDYNGYWWYMNMNSNWVKCTFQKILKKFKIYDFRKNKKMKLFLKKEEEFIAITKKYIDSIFNSLELNKNVDTIVLDQAIPATHPGLAKRYFQNSKVINIDRDPRAVYIDLITEEKKNGDIVGHVGFDVAKTHDINLFISWYKKCRKEGITGEALSIQFEDFVLNFEQVAKKIEEYTGLDKKNHINKLKYFNPSISKNNVINWKDYEKEFPDEIKIIERELSDYLYEK